MYNALIYRIVGISLSANFPQISRMGSLLGKIYFGMLHEIQLWVAIAEIGRDAIMSRWPINV